MFDNSFEQWHSEPDWIDNMLGRVERWETSIDEKLRDYCKYLEFKSVLNEEGLQMVYNVLESGDIKEEDLTTVFNKNISRACAQYIVGNTPELKNFHGSQYSLDIETFKELTKNFEKLTREELVAKLSAKVPQVKQGVANDPEIVLLLKAIGNSGRATTLRNLFVDTQSLMKILCPCMLMSPHSVAQYLDPTYPPFDLVVFDEASQMRTSESIGAIARGKELIVVGDPEQMPPSQQVGASIGEIDEESVALEDQESILEDCLAISMPYIYLQWHYRSKHESLIAFSNENYYKGELYTFPSPDNLVSKVTLRQVEGFYSNRQNKAEAKSIVDEIMRRLKDPVLSKRSIGVVTFSGAQKEIVDKMLDAEFVKQPDLEEVAKAGDEPIFVKNLENVQGDERDVILFSICYGPDEKGKLIYTIFSLLNRRGAGRRLNVAFSRARYEMMIFSTLKPEQIDLNRVKGEGTIGLRRFLEFARRGTQTSLKSVKKSVHENNQGAVELIAARINKDTGYDAHTDVGSSEFKVDIGIVHPKDTNKYLLGVLCDGRNYYKGGTALDRNNTQISVLNSLGWKITRVWLLDWWDNPEKELKRLQKEIEEALEADQHIDMPDVVTTDAGKAIITKNTDMPIVHITAKKIVATTKVNMPTVHIVAKKIDATMEVKMPIVHIIAKKLL
jgi:hypothetical protein